MFTALTFFDCMMARVQVPMAAVEFVVGYHDLVLSLVGLSPYITELVYPEISLRSKRFQSSYCAKVRVPSPSPVIHFFFFALVPAF